ncbi:unnamed protein product [Phaeothamnion confervicola]
MERLILATLQAMPPPPPRRQQQRDGLKRRPRSCPVMEKCAAAATVSVAGAAITAARSAAASGGTAAGAVAAFACATASAGKAADAVGFVTNGGQKGAPKLNAFDVYTAQDIIDRYESGALATEVAAGLVRRASVDVSGALRRSLGARRGGGGSDTGDGGGKSRDASPAGAATARALMLVRGLQEAAAAAGNEDGAAARALRELLAGTALDTDSSTATAATAADGTAAAGSSASDPVVVLGSQDLETLANNVAALLNSEEGEALAAALVADAERRLGELQLAGKGLGQSPAVRGLMKRLGDPALEARLLKGIEGVDAAAVVAGAERAASSHEERSRLLDKVKDQTVEFLLEHLPALEVPPISGTSGAVRYTVTNLDMSGFRMRKEDVTVVMNDVSGSPVFGSAAVAETVDCGGGGGGANGGIRRKFFGRGGGGGTAAAASTGPVALAAEISYPGPSGCQPPALEAGMALASDGGGDGGDASGHNDTNAVSEAMGAPVASPPGGCPPQVPPGSSDKRSPPPGSIRGSGGNGHSFAFDRSETPSANCYGSGAGSSKATEAALVGSGAAAATDRSVAAGGGGAAPPQLPGVPAIAGEVFTIVACRIQAQFRGLRWAYKQERFPYGGGSGAADAAVVNGSVRLGFAVKRGRLSESDDAAEGPVIVLSSKRVAMERLELEVADCRMAWLINLLAQVFTNTIRQYVERSLVTTLEAHASELLGAVNGFARGSWPLVLSLAGVDLGSLPPASADDLRQARGALAPPKLPPVTALKRHRSFVLGAPPLPQPWDGNGGGGPGGRAGGAATAVPLRARDFNLTFAATGPLGLQIDVVHPATRGAGGGGRRVVVVGLYPGGQAEGLLAAANAASAAAATAAAANGASVSGVSMVLPPLAGAEVVKIGDLDVTSLRNLDVLEILKASPRPLELTFRQYVPDIAAITPSGGAGGGGVRMGGRARKVCANGVLAPPPGLVKVKFAERVLGLRFRPSAALGPAAIEVSGFAPIPDTDAGGGEAAATKIGTAEACGLIKPGMVLYSVDGERTLGLPYADAVGRLSAAGRPVLFGFLPGCDERVIVASPPDDLRLRIMQNHAVVTSLAPVRARLVTEGRIAVGDVVTAINGVPLPTERGFGRDVAMLRTAAMYPLRLTMRRSSPAAVAAAAAAVGARTAGLPPPPSALSPTAVGQPSPSSWPPPSSLSAAAAAAAAAVASSTTHEAVVVAPGDLCATFEPDPGSGAPAVVALDRVPGSATRSGRVAVGNALVAVNGAPVAERATTVAACWRLLDEASYPCELLFRDLTRWAALTAELQGRGGISGGDEGGGGGYGVGGCGGVGGNP